MIDSKVTVRFIIKSSAVSVDVWQFGNDIEIMKKTKPRRGEKIMRGYAR